MPLLAHHLTELSVIIHDQKDRIVDEVAEIQNQNHPLHLPQICETLRPLRIDFVELFAHTLSVEIEQCFMLFDAWGDDVGIRCLNMGMPLDAALNETKYYRRIITAILLEESVRYGFGIHEFSHLKEKFDEIMDYSVYKFSMAFIHSNEKIKRSAQTAINELSAPIVPVGYGIGILPLVGDIDTERAKIIIEKVPVECLSLSINELIIDLSGVPIVDTMVAHQLLQVAKILTVLGVKTKISGIRPEIAQTMVVLNVSMENHPTFSSLQHALEKIGFAKK